MKIALIGPAPPLRGGIAAHTAGLARTFGSLGHEVRVLSYSRIYPRLLFPGERDTEATASVGEPVLDTLAPGSWRRARRWIAEGRFDLLVVEWWHPIAAAAIGACLWAQQPPGVLICHNSRCHEGFPAERLLLRMILGHTVGAVCHSRYVADSLGRTVPEIWTEVVAMPYLLDLEPLVGCDKRAIRRRIGVDVDTRIVLLAGHARAYKGVDVLVDAWGMADLSEDAVLVIAGESYLGRGQLDRLVARSGRAGTIRLMNRYLCETDLLDLLVAADCVVFPYRQASQSGLLPLARVAGAAIIASDVGGLCEEILGDDRAIAVPPGDPVQLAAALSGVLQKVPTRAGDPALEGRMTRGIIEMAEERWHALADACFRIAGEGCARADRPKGSS